MTYISERIAVRCPYADAPFFLAAFVAEHSAADGKARVALRTGAGGLVDRRRPLSERIVIATIVPHRSTGDAQPSYAVTWPPKSDAPAPEFSGDLAVERHQRDDYFGLILKGHFRSSTVMVGRIRPLDRRAAHVAERDLLRIIADHVEQAHAHDEAAHAGHKRLAHLVHKGGAESEYVASHPATQTRA